MNDTESEFEQVGLSDLESQDGTEEEGAKEFFVHLPRSFQTRDNRNSKHAPPQDQSATSSLSFVDKVENLKISSGDSADTKTIHDLDESWSEVNESVRNWGLEETPSFAWSETASVASTGSSVVSGFDLLSLSGAIKRRCQRCSYHNGEKDGVCGLCGCALVANPCVDMDEQIARHLQQKEENDSWKALLQQEKKRALLATRTVLERSQMLSKDVSTFVLENFKANEIGIIPEVNLTILASRFMDCVDAAMAAFCGGKGVAVVYHFSPNENGRMDEIRKDGLGDGARVSSSMKAAFLYQGSGFIEKRELASPTLPTISENSSDFCKAEPAISGWIVAILDGPRGTHERFVKCGRDEAVVKILDRSEFALPLVHFAAYKRHDDIVSRVFRGEFDALISDSVPLVYEASVSIHTIFLLCRLVSNLLRLFSTGGMATRPS